MNRGRCVLSLELDEVKVSQVLIEAGYLHPSEEDDRERLKAALETALDHMLVSDDFVGDA